MGKEPSVSFYLSSFCSFFLPSPTYTMSSCIHTILSLLSSCTHTYTHTLFSHTLILLHTHTILSHTLSLTFLSVFSLLSVSLWSALPTIFLSFSISLSLSHPHSLSLSPSSCSCVSGGWGAEVDWQAGGLNPMRFFFSLKDRRLVIERGLLYSLSLSLSHTHTHNKSH